MEYVEKPEFQPHGQGHKDVPDRTSSETSFGPFVVPEAQQASENGSSETSFSLGYSIPLLPPGDSQTALNMLNLEIQAHAHTEESLRQITMKASSLERHYVHQSIVLAAWHASYEESCAKVHLQAQEIEQLKEEIESLKAKNQRLRDEMGSWRATSRRASA